MIALSDAHRLARLDRRLEWDDLNDEHFIVSKMDPGSDIEDLIVKHLAVLGRHPAIEPRPVGRDALIALVGLGLGVGLVGEGIAAATYPGVIFKSLQGSDLPFFILWSETNDNPALRRFLSQSRFEVKRMAAQRLSIAAASEKLDPPP